MNALGGLAWVARSAAGHDKFWYEVLQSDPGEDIARTGHAHPTLGEAVRQAAMGVTGWTMQM